MNIIACSSILKLGTDNAGTLEKFDFVLFSSKNLRLAFLVPCNLIKMRCSNTVFYA